MVDSTTEVSGHADIAATVRAVRNALESVAVEADAAPMEAYMGDRFPFLGVKSRGRRNSVRPIARSWRTAHPDDVVALAGALWSETEREFQHVGADLLRSHARHLEPAHITDVADLITTNAWWDTVDTLAAHTIGPIVLRHPELVSVTDRWIDLDDDVSDGPTSEMWLARSALIHQLSWKDRTDADRLFRYVLRRGGDDQFFLRKAAGWALRQYARTDPDAVRTFVDRHRDDLSSLTVREATKHL